MTRSAWVVCLGLSFCMLASSASASKFTPLEWQAVVKRHAIPGLVGQRKHLTWVRDTNRNFVDDEIEHLFHHNGHKHKANLIVDLNTCMPDAKIKSEFARYGKVGYIGKLITFFMIDDVKWEDVHRIAARPDVAMVENQTMSHVANDVATRAIQVYQSDVTPNGYAPNTVAQATAAGTANGDGVTVAFFDSGLDDGGPCASGQPGGCASGTGHDTFIQPTGARACYHQLPGFPAPGAQSRKFKAGFDAFLENSATANGSTNPADANGHGTHVAGTAVGAGFNGAGCRNPGANVGTPPNCAGVAPAACVVDIKVCDSTGSCPAPRVQSGLDWLGLNSNLFRVKLANMSIVNCTASDGTDAMSQQVNYLVGLGIAVVVSHADSNSPTCGGTHAAGSVMTSFPGAASFAITVAGTNDQGTVRRDGTTHDVVFANNLIGPRSDFSTASPNLYALKPDLSAPATNINSARSGTTNGVSVMSGTSSAAALVTGSAALIMQLKNAAGTGIDPGGLKDLLLHRAVDQSFNTAAFSTLPAPWNNWDRALGVGMLNTFGAINVAGAGDVKFPTCATPAPSLGTNCGLVPPLPPWNNNIDITTDHALSVSDPNPNYLIAMVENKGAAAADVTVNFGVYVSAAGNMQFWHIGAQRVTVPAAGQAGVTQSTCPSSSSGPVPTGTIRVCQQWNPTSTNHTCAQVSIDDGLDTDFSNNVTQRNLSISPSVYQVRVENPLFEPAKMTVEVKSSKPGWACKIDERDKQFELGPFDCPRDVNITYDAPAGTKANDRADCEVKVSLTTKKEAKARLVGGVTVQTFVPEPCRLFGRIADIRGVPVQGAKVTFTPDKHHPIPPVTATTEKDGIFSLTVTPFIPQTILVDKGEGQRAAVLLEPKCGVLDLVLGKGTLRVRNEEELPVEPGLKR